MIKRILFLSLLISKIASGQSTVGVTQYDIPNTEGYVLFSPIPDTHTYLIDKCGRVVHEWTHVLHPGLSFYLLDDGSLLRTGNVNNSVFNVGGSGGALEKYDWNGNLTWSYHISDANQCQHHDAIQLPNGNIIAIVWDAHPITDAIAHGKSRVSTLNHLWSEKIVELQPIGTDSATIVWEWKLWDHLIQDHDSTKLDFGSVAQHPELMDINFFVNAVTNPDWIHLNGIDYNPQLDQILLSAHNISEMWIIDHSTTTVEAATHSGGNSGMGGDFMYRWGNARSYKRATITDEKFWGQHHATWIPPGYPDAGKILVFNNGLNRPGGDFSTIEIIEPPIDSTNHYPIGLSSAWLPANSYRTYTAPVPTDFFGQFISGVYPLENGSFMVCEGPTGDFFELDSAFNKVWEYVNPVTSTAILSQGQIPSNNSVFRCAFYPPNFPGFNGVTLSPGSEIELNPLSPSICEVVGLFELNRASKIKAYPNPAGDFIHVEFPENNSMSNIEITDVFGNITLQSDGEKDLNVSRLSPGIYFLRIINKSEKGVFRIIKR